MDPPAIKAAAVNAATEAELTAAIGNGNTVDVTEDIYLTATIFIYSVTGLTINGNGFKVDGQGEVRCFSLQNSDVALTGLTITNVSVKHPPKFIS